MSSYTLFHFLSLSLTSHLSSLHLPHSFLLASSSLMGFSPMPLHLPHLFISHGFFPYLFISLIDIFISHEFFPLTSSSPQLIAPSIFYLNFPRPTVPTIGNTTLKFFFCPCAFVVVCVWNMQLFSPFALWFDLWILRYVLLQRFIVFIFIFVLDLWVLNLRL